MPEASESRLGVEAFFHEPTNTVSYLVSDPQTRSAAIIDPVLDFDQRSGRTGTRSTDALLEKASGLEVAWVLETHVHADHLSAAPHVKARTGAPIAIGSGITEVQRRFKDIFGLAELEPDGRAFDRLLRDGERLDLGGLEIEVMHTPGHTPDSVSYRIGDDVFVGDTLFMPDYGTARCDFPGGDARALFRSIQRLLALPPATRLWMCHDYKAPGRDRFAWQSTVAAERESNIHLKDGVDENAFVAMREARDKTLSMPALLLPSIQVNIRAGALPPAEADGTSYLRLPLNRF